MLSTLDILSKIEKREIHQIKELAKLFQMQIDQMEGVLRDLSQANLVEYNPQTGNIRLADWLSRIGEKIIGVRPTIGAIILPKHQEIKVQDVNIENFTEHDLEIRIMLNPDVKEIAICTI